ncbi:MAG TPA: SDR family oxidoreductase [Terriglobia bacterium]|nr:SDR family oxidoreductase [Terriglobia bacterium]
MTFDLHGKVAIVTGGGSGLGRDIGLSMAKAGASVVVADLNPAAGQKTVDEILESSGEAILFELDVADSAGVNEMVRRVVERFGAVHILVNSAGITKRLPPLDFPEEDFDRIIAVNLKGTFLCCQAVARQMAKQGGGKIVNLTSIGGMVGLPNTVAYCASKGGVVQMTRALAIDLARYKINVNAVAPSLANTPIAATVFQNKQTLEWFLSKVPLGRLCEPRDVSAAVLFLSSSASDFVTGHILAVDGGFLAE